jgi:hypothetical protein
VNYNLKVAALVEAATDLARQAENVGNGFDGRTTIPLGGGALILYAARVRATIADLVCETPAPCEPVVDDQRIKEAERHAILDGKPPLNGRRS